MEKNLCQKKWTKFKYLILAKDHKTYLDIRQYLKNDRPSLDILNDKLSYALNLKESKKDIINAYLHIWGHFKKEAKDIEKEEFFKLIDMYKEDEVSHKKILSFLKKLLENYPDSYLENSLIFKDEKEIYKNLSN